ncbi:hypothetical protein [Microbacterium sp. W4I20]|uniref:hypothetical protein n=1 Tax=Microbacterium sp. W4I20 TaxID=3042262 RepID=UPI0027883667|nr:hypothetical protein [Microbacterium sp. W4I20]MDQ0728767.1 hypothetical protein [Microbacterium sp. W4I20]
MKHLTAPRSRRTLVALIAVAVMAFLVVAVGTYGLITGSPEPEDSPEPNSSKAVPNTEESRRPATTVSRLPKILPIRDAETFAGSVATALFTWDTGRGFVLLDYTGVILDVADPTGIEQPGLAADIAAYLPTPNAWVQLRQYATTQRLEITSMYVPDAWSEALSQTRPGQLPEGATAYTIEGIRHRAGTWNGDPITAQQAVALTVFIACPTDDSCYVLRLSELNNPLR